MQLPVVQTKTCGECNACCKVFSVPEVGKVDGAWCHYCVVGSGCAIYDNRPFACRMYACFWLHGKLSDRFRPDRIGVMIDIGEVRIGERVVGILYLWEMREGALEQPAIAKMIEDNLNVGFVVVRRYPSSENSYRKRVTMRDGKFTSEEAMLILAEVND